MVRDIRAADKPPAADPPRLHSVVVARERVARVRALLPDVAPAVAAELDKLDELIGMMDDGFTGILDEMRQRRPLLPETAALCATPPASGVLGGGQTA